MQINLYALVLPSCQRALLFASAWVGKGLGHAIISDSLLVAGICACIALGAMSEITGSRVPSLTLADIWQWESWSQLVVDLVFGLIVFYLLQEFIPYIASYDCDNEVRFSFWAYVIGAAIFGLSASLLSNRGIDHIQTLTLIGFFWIAPYVGFFYGPWYAAQILASNCNEAAVSVSLLVAASMPIVGFLGWQLGTWLRRPQA